MRTTPTREQMAYLASIGVSEAIVAHPGLGAPQPVKDSHNAIRVSARRANRLWATLLVIIALLLCLAGLACAEEPWPDGNSAVAPGDQIHHRGEIAAPQNIAGIETDIANLRAPAGHAATLDDLAAQQQKIQLVQILFETLKIHMELDALRDDLAQKQQGLAWAVTWLAVVSLLGISLIIMGRIIMEKRIRNVEQSVISRLSETVADSGSYPMTSLELAKNTEAIAEPATDEEPRIRPARPGPRRVQSPTEQMQVIISSANEARHIRVKPERPSSPWQLGLATHKGNVRAENQDFGLCFRIDGRDVLIVADGCGGVPHGQRAAYLAVISAAVSLVRVYGMAPRWHPPTAKEAAAKAIKDAAHRLAVEGDKLNITDVRGGLRTTLIVVIGDKREIGYAYIGDGGGYIIRPTGEVHRFLDPQKADDLAMNVLAASLGPMMEGEPVSGIWKRTPGDFLIVGTDGVFDRVESTFSKDVLRGCIKYKGDLQKTAEHILDDLASFQDGAGYVCDDNLTLGIMGDGTPPKLSPGFWSASKENLDAPIDVIPAEGATCGEEVMS